MFLPLFPYPCILFIFSSYFPPSISHDPGLPPCLGRPYILVRLFLSFGALPRRIHMRSMILLLVSVSLHYPLYCCLFLNLPRPWTPTMSRPPLHTCSAISIVWRSSTANSHAAHDLALTFCFASLSTLLLSIAPSPSSLRAFFQISIRFRFWF